MKIFIEEDLFKTRQAVIYFDESEKEIYRNMNLSIPLKSIRVIKKDKNGMEYISIPNVFGLGYPIRHSFNYRIHDAIESVVNGHGDFIDMNMKKYPFKNRVIYYIDRGYGDVVKAESIQKLKSLKKCFSIMLYDDRVRFDENRFLRYHDMSMYGLTQYDHRLQYESEEEVNFLIQTLNDDFDEVHDLKNQKKSGLISDSEFRSKTYHFPMILKYLNHDHMTFKAIQDLKI